MAFLISRRLTNNLLTSSLFSLSLPSTTTSKPSSHFYLLHASSSSSAQKPQILEPCFIRSAPFATFRPSNPTFSPGNDNRQTRSSSSQIPDSNHFSLLENEIRDSLRKSMENMSGLKNALTVLGLVHTVIGAWVVGSLPFSPSILEQGFLASAVPLLVARRMKLRLQMMSSLTMKTEEGLLLISKLTWEAAGELLMVAFPSILAQLVVLFSIPVDLVMIPRISISMMTMMSLPAFWGLQILRAKSMNINLLIWQLQGNVCMIGSWNWMGRRQVLKVLNILLLRLKNASYLAAALSCPWFLYVQFHTYGILTF